MTRVAEKLSLIALMVSLVLTGTIAVATPGAGETKKSAADRPAPSVLLATRATPATRTDLLAGIDVDALGKALVNDVRGELENRLQNEFRPR